MREFDVLTYLRKKDELVKVSGVNAVVLCPVCETRKLYVLLNEKNTARGVQKAGAWLCFKCKEHGTTVESLIMLLDNTTFKLAREYIRDNSTVLRDIDVLFTQYIQSTHTTTQKPLPEVTHIPGFQPILHELPHALRVRGISLRQCKLHNIGLCTYGPYRNRIIIPIKSVDGRTVSFVARHVLRKPQQGVKKVKYCKKTTSDSVISRCLFNYDRAKKCKRVIIVEDVFSAIRIGKSAVATYGTNLSVDQEILLDGMDADEFVLMWDRDATVQYAKCGLSPSQTKALAGNDCTNTCAHCRRYRHTMHVLERLSALRVTRLAILPTSADPKDMSRADCLKLAKKAEIFTRYSDFLSLFSV